MGRCQEERGAPHQKNNLGLNCWRGPRGPKKLARCVQHLCNSNAADGKAADDTVHGSVGRASDCRPQQISDGSWFDSGVNRIFASNLLHQRTGPNPPHAPPPQRPTATTTNADSTLKSSQAVVHPSTNGALRHLTSEFRRDLVHWTRYGRQRHLNLEQSGR